MTNNSFTVEKLFKILSAITATDPTYQLAIQYPGKSLIRDWNYSEIVIARDNSVCVLVRSSDSLDSNISVCKGILEANPYGKIILLLGRDQDFTIQDFESNILPNATFVCIKESNEQSETARNILALSQANAFDLGGISKSFGIRIHELGFQESHSISRDQQQYIATAQQMGMQLGDAEKHDLPIGCSIFVLKSIYPVLRDLSDFRGLLVHGWLFGSPLLAYRQTIVSEIASDINSLRDLLAAFEPTSRYQYP